MIKIKEINLREIFDSRGEPTIEVDLIESSGLLAQTQIPSGKSRGKKEAAVFTFQEAASALKKIKKEILGRQFGSISEIDKFLIKFDGTKNKTRLGGNLTLGISIAFARVFAAHRKQEVWQALHNEFFKRTASEEKPLIFSNLINGGAHAKNNLAIQEYLVIAKPRKSYTEVTKKLIKLYRNLGEFLKKKNNLGVLPIGDEGGYAVNFKNNFEPIQVLEKLIFGFKFGKDFELGLDAAASSFYKNASYKFEDKKIKSQSLLGIYLSYLKNSKLLVSIEDPFAEDDVAGFKAFVKTKGALVIGDDLTVTNPILIQKYFKERALGGVIIKPNQIGTIFETCEAIKTARKNNLKIIISHRSGETEDNFIIHLAKACGADGVKIGAPARERIFRFNELIRIYGE